MSDCKCGARGPRGFPGAIGATGATGVGTSGSTGPTGPGSEAAFGAATAVVVAVPQTLIAGDLIPYQALAAQSGMVLGVSNFTVLLSGQYRVTAIVQTTPQSALGAIQIFVDGSSVNLSQSLLSAGSPIVLDTIIGIIAGSVVDIRVLAPGLQIPVGNAARLTLERLSA